MRQLVGFLPTFNVTDWLKIPAGFMLLSGSSHDAKPPSGLIREIDFLHGGGSATSVELGLYDTLVHEPGTSPITSMPHQLLGTATIPGPLTYGAPIEGFGPGPEGTEKRRNDFVMDLRGPRGPEGGTGLNGPPKEVGDVLTQVFPLEYIGYGGELIVEGAMTVKATRLTKAAGLAGEALFTRIAKGIPFSEGSYVTEPTPGNTFKVDISELTGPEVFSLESSVEFIRVVQPENSWFPIEPYRPHAPLTITTRLKPFAGRSLEWSEATNPSGVYHLGIIPRGGDLVLPIVATGTRLQKAGGVLKDDPEVTATESSESRDAAAYQGGVKILPLTCLI